MAQSLSDNVYGAGLCRWRGIGDAVREQAWIWSTLPDTRPHGARLLVRRRSREVFALDDHGVVVKHWFRVNPRDWLAALTRPSDAMREYRATAEAYRRGRVPRGPLACAERRRFGTYSGACLILPLVAGELSFGDLLKSSAAKAARIERLCARYATELGGHHRANMLHNDYYPSNVMLAGGDDEELVTIDWADSRVLDDGSPATRDRAMQGEFARGVRRLLYPMYGRGPIESLFDRLYPLYAQATGRFGAADRPVFVSVVNEELAAEAARYRAPRKRESSRALKGEAGGWRYALMQHDRCAELEAYLRGEGGDFSSTAPQAAAVWQAVTAMPSHDPSVAAIVARIDRAGSRSPLLVIDPGHPYDPAETLARYEGLWTFRVR